MARGKSKAEEVDNRSNDAKSQEAWEKSEKARITGEEPEDGGTARDYAVEGNDTKGYVGVSPEYQTYANETEKPYGFEETESAKELREAAEERNAAQRVEDDDEKSDDDDKEPQTPATQPQTQPASTPPTTPASPGDKK